MIGACRDLTDYRRASEWIEATERYCERQSLSGFPGICRIHRAEVAAVGGGWERGRAGARAGDDRARRLPRHAAAGRRLLCDRRHPPAQGRLRGRRGRAPRGPRPRSIAATRARADPAGRGQGQGRRRGDQRGRRRGDLGSLGSGATAPGPGARSRSPPATWSGRATAVDELAGIVEGYPSPALEAGRQAALGRVLRRRGRRGRRRPRSSGRRSRAGARSARRTRWPGRERSCRGRCAPSRTTTSADLELGRRSMSSAGSAPGSTSRPPSASCATPRTAAAAPRPRGRRSCSPTSWARRTSPRRSATRRGSGSCAGTTTCSGAWSRSGAARSSTRPATGSSRRSSRPAPASIARSRSSGPCVDHRASDRFRARRSGSACTRAEANRRGTDYSGIGVHVAARVGGARPGRRDPGDGRDPRGGGRVSRRRMRGRPPSRASPRR